LLDIDVLPELGREWAANEWVNVATREKGLTEVNDPHAHCVRCHQWGAKRPADGRAGA